MKSKAPEIHAKNSIESQNSMLQNTTLSEPNICGTKD